MADATDTGAETKAEETSVETSGKDWEAEAKHFQSIADKRDADYKALNDRLEKMQADQNARQTAELEEKEKFKELYEGSKAQLEATAKEKAALDLRVKLQDFVSEKHPEFAPDLKWIAPHVSDEETIASVVDEYVKAHPKAQGAGTANLGNKGAAEGTTIKVSKAQLDDPVQLGELLEKHPTILQMIESGEAILT
jgi:hypothetical protein